MDSRSALRGASSSPSRRSMASPSFILRSKKSGAKPQCISWFLVPMKCANQAGDSDMVGAPRSPRRWQVRMCSANSAIRITIGNGSCLEMPARTYASLSRNPVCTDRPSHNANATRRRNVVFPDPGSPTMTRRRLVRASSNPIDCPTTDLPLVSGMYKGSIGNRCAVPAPTCTPRISIQAVCSDRTGRPPTPLMPRRLTCHWSVECTKARSGTGAPSQPPPAPREYRSKRSARAVIEVSRRVEGAGRYGSRPEFRMPVAPFVQGINCAGAQVIGIAEDHPRAQSVQPALERLKPGDVALYLRQQLGGGLALLDGSRDAVGFPLVERPLAILVHDESEHLFTVPRRVFGFERGDALRGRRAGPEAPSRSGVPQSQPARPPERLFPDKPRAADGRWPRNPPS